MYIFVVIVIYYVLQERSRPVANRYNVIGIILDAVWKIGTVRRYLISVAVRLRVCLIPFSMLFADTARECWFRRVR